MIRIFFEFMDVFGNKYTFLKDNFIFQNIKYFYWKIRTITYNVKESNEENIIFFTKNAERVDAIANLLYDEQSKKEYLGIIKFRQTLAKKDFPYLAANNKEQYFIKEIQFCKDEVFIDCGAYNGDTINEILKRIPNFKQIIALEPDLNNFNKLTKKYNNNSKIRCINAGAYDKDGTVIFDTTNGLQSGKIINSPEQERKKEELTNIKVKMIDNLEIENVSFIKMDIEGAELNALKGAEKTILKYKPKLAISIYHSNEDMIEIAEYIHNLIPEYKLYVRHHMPLPYTVETILYALL